LVSTLPNLIGAPLLIEAFQVPTVTRALGEGTMVWEISILKVTNKTNKQPSLIPKGYKCFLGICRDVLQLQLSRNIY
jgi:hypothetical protein